MIRATKERSNATGISHPALSVSNLTLIVHTLWPQHRKRLHAAGELTYAPFSLVNIILLIQTKKKKKMLEMFNFNLANLL